MTTITDAEVELLSKRKRWTRDDVQKLAEMFPGQRYELIEGDLINKMGQGPRHATVIRILNKLLSAAYPGKVNIQSPISLPEPDGIYSEPEPDVVLLHTEDIGERHPGPKDVALLIEVSDTSLQVDRVIKGRLYSRSGIEEYWIVDIPSHQVLCFRNPSPGGYQMVRTYGSEEQVSALSGFSISVKNLFV